MMPASASIATHTLDVGTAGRNAVRVSQTHSNKTYIMVQERKMIFRLLQVLRNWLKMLVLKAIREGR